MFFFPVPEIFNTSKYIKQIQLEELFYRNKATEVTRSVLIDSSGSVGQYYRFQCV